MKTYKNLYERLCSTDNLLLAYKKASKGKSSKDYVIRFKESLEANLLELQEELTNFTYTPHPLKVFTVMDPKTRTISASHFRDRVVHHAICNIIGPILEARFIHDSFANQKGKGTHRAILRYESFLRKCRHGYALKADIRHCFDTIDHQVLLNILGRTIADPDVIWLLTQILANIKDAEPGKGMPLGNLTSQFLCNVYLNELDMYVKHVLRAKMYIRYVDDFVIVHENRELLESWMGQIGTFLDSELKLQLHPDKSSVVSLNRGLTLLGFRIFRRYRLLKKSNARRIWRRISILKAKAAAGELTNDQVRERVKGWLAYAMFANTYRLRTRLESEVAQPLHKKKG